MEVTHKTCATCGKHLHIDRYYNVLGGRKRKEGKRYRANSCKTCFQKRKDAEQSANPSAFLAFRLSQLRYARKKKGDSLDITAKQLTDLYYKQSGLCALSGLPMSYDKRGNAHHKRNSTRISIDRIDPDGDYVIENIQLVCTIVNFMKGTMKNEDFIQMCRAIGDNHGM